MTTDQLTGAPRAPDLFTQLRELWLRALARARLRGDLNATREALEHLEAHILRDIGLGPKEHPLLSRVDIILQLHR
ncbi:hypothetical protein EJV46_08535 [Roseococcus sp. SYP-B2431]|uniref:hypothetical protein n=1 Tax=Roseococcus sp. SYP-B2431 TaxID=2496640 RepID=UPI001039B4C0|nr:hypothetical protein [Roseococcus sp. SYP-B2431]TCH98612.1 hypothetical protein EJV46_08535 [Roseococcus sp. SYP-B2431]